MKLTDSTADALWENREKMNPSVFSAIMLLWKEKQHNIVAHKSSEKISGRAIWRKAKERLLDSALVSQVPIVIVVGRHLEFSDLLSPGPEAFCGVIRAHALIGAKHDRDNLVIIVFICFRILLSETICK